MINFSISNRVEGSSFCEFNNELIDIYIVRVIVSRKKSLLVALLEFFEYVNKPRIKLPKADIVTTINSKVDISKIIEIMKLKIQHSDQNHYDMLSLNCILPIGNGVS